MATLEALSNLLPSEADQQQWDKLMALGNLLPDEGQEAKGSYISEAGKGLAGGAVSAVGTSLKGAAAQQEVAREDRRQMMLGLVDFFDRIDKGTFEEGSVTDPDQLGIVEQYKAAPAEQRAVLREAFTTAATYQPPAEDITQTPLYQAGKATQQFSEDQFRAAKDFEKSWTRDITEGLGSLGVFAATAIGGRGATLATGSAMSAGEAVDRAVKAGASKEDILQAANLGVMPGTTEQIPLDVLLNKIPIQKWGKAVNAIVRLGANIAAEAGQEGLQQAMQNLIAKYVYKPDQDISEGVGHSMVIGGIVGGVAGAAATPFTYGSEQRAPAPAATPEAAPAEAPPGAPAEAPPGAAPAETLLSEVEAPAPTPVEAAAIEALPQQVEQAVDLPDSPRLTEQDRKSPIPNEIIDAGKATVEAATGQPSTFTTTTEINGKREVVTGNVSDLVSQNRAETAAVVSDIMQGVSTPEIIAGTQPAAAPASATEVAATLAPTGVPATPEPSVAETAAAPTKRPLEEMVKQLRARSTALDAEVEDLMSRGKSIRFEAKDDPTRKVMVGPDMSEPGMFRVTYIDSQGPSGHTVHNTMQEAVRGVVGSYKPVGTIAKEALRRDSAITPAGREVPVVYALVEADDLVTSQRDEGGSNPAYPQELQPRDRSRGTSEVQINQIAQNLDPRLLDNNVSATDGAPIISEDGVVESGNGRALGIRRAYNQNLPGAQAYRDYLQSQGYLDLAAAGRMKKPVLVRIRQGQLEQGERTAFTREANERTTMTLSATEKAMADAAAMRPEVVGLYRGGEVAEAGNRDFVRSFMQSVVSPNEQGAMVTPDGELSQEAIRRIQAALLARAFGDPDLVGALVESTDNNIKAIGGAMMDVAGLWSQMRAEAAEGTISPDVDVTPYLLEAIRLVQRARNEGRPLSEYVAQTDIFSGTTVVPEAEMLLRLMFRNNASWTQPAGREKLAEALRFFATEARKTAPGIDLLGETAPAAHKILEEAKKRQYGQEETQEKLALGGRAPRPDDGAPAGRRAVEAKPRSQPEGRAAVSRKAAAKKKSKLKAKVEAKRAEKAKAPEAKFSRGEEVHKRLSPEQLAVLKKYFDFPKIRRAIAAAKAIPHTLIPRDTPDILGFLRGRVGVYNFGTRDKPVYAGSLEEAVHRLVDRGRKLAATELKIKPWVVEQGRKAIIVIGPPAAGKSTIANAIAKRLKAAIADGDDAKKIIPEYYQPDPETGKLRAGLGANAVHEESSYLGKMALNEMIVAGDNLVIPKVGDTLASIEKLRADLASRGYTVELHLMNVDAEAAVQRMIGRYESSGRLIAPTYFLDVVAEPPFTYIDAKEAGNFDGYAIIESEQGVPARVSEAVGRAQSLSVGEGLERDGSITPKRGGEGRRLAPRVQEKPEAKAKVGQPEAPPRRLAEVKKVQGGQIHFALSPAFADKADAVLKDLRKALDKLGLTSVDLKVWQQIFADMDYGAFGLNGVYLKNLIQVSLQAAQDFDLTDVIHHEAIHAMFDLGLFTGNESAILRRYSEKHWITDRIKQIYPEDQWIEEGIAHAYTDWLAGAKMDGVITKAFKKIQTFLKATAQTLTGYDFRTVDDVFRQVTSGEVGRRSATAPALRRPGFAVTETVDMFEGKREQYVIPGAEKITDKRLAELRAKAPMKGKVPQKSVESMPLFGDQKDQMALFSVPPSGPNDPRFMLQSAPHTTAQSQAVMQGFIQRGQPIDRAIRTPWALLGGIDKQGRWRVSKRLSDRYGITPARAKQVREGASIGGIIGAGIGTFAGGPVGTAAGFVVGGSVGAYILGGPAWTTNGAFGWFAGIAENAKRGLITNYGLDPEYVETFRRSELYKNMKEREGAEHLKVLHNAGVGPTEAKVLQQILSGEPVSDANLTRMAVPIRKAIDDMGAEAVSLGLISAESFERNRGAYLHRVYAKHEEGIAGGLAGWVSKGMTKRRKKILADGMKGRGMFMDQPVETIMKDVDSYKEGKRGAPKLGEKFRIIDEVQTIADLQGGQPKTKTMRRVYLPADEAVPAKYQGANWKDQGTWEVRKEGKTTTLWRDYTKDERGKMGEIVDARYTMAKTFMLWANDLATGKFYRDIAVREDWAQTKPPPDGTWKDGGEYSAGNGRYWTDPEIQWVKVPDTTIEKTGGKKRWGALSGKYVRAEIWRDINELNLQQNPGTWRRIYRQWKANHTARHPVVHMNNVMSNLMFMDMADVRGQDLVAGIKAFFSGGKDYQEALANGAFGADTVTQELRDNVLQPILDEITQQTSGGTKRTILNWQGIPFLQNVQLVGTVLDKLWTGVKYLDDGMMKGYRAEDEIFRMALYMRRRSQGESPRVAAIAAREQFLDYDIRAPWIVALRNTMLPFISYTYRAVPMIMNAMQLRPWKLAKYATIAYAVNALSYMLDDDDEGEEYERAALKEQEQGYTWLGVPRMVRMPWRDKHGLPVFFDVRRWIPAGDVFDTTGGSEALPMPGPLHFGGPLQLAFEYNLNKKAFDGKEITNDLTDTPGERVVKVADWAWKAWTPPAFWNPGSHYWTKIWNAAHGAKPSPDSPPYSVSQALLSSVGIKVAPLDVENGILWHYRDFQKEQKELRSQLYSNAYQLERGVISQKTHDANAARIMWKFENLERKADEFSERTTPQKVE